MAMDAATWSGMRIQVLGFGLHVETYADVFYCAGTFAYTSGCTLVVEDLNSGSQDILQGLPPHFAIDHRFDIEPRRPQRRNLSGCIAA
jgi:hypothetical protein